MKPIALILSLALALPIVACKPATVVPGAVAPTFYSGAATAMDVFSTTLVQAQSMFETANQEGMISTADYQNGERVFLQVATSAVAVRAALQAVAPQTTVIAQINTLIAQVASVPQAFAIKNPQSQAMFTALINSLANILKTVQTQVTTPTTATVPVK